LIVAARESRDDRIDHLGVLDASVDRNAFGRQVDSFETSLEVEGLAEPFPAVFIRAPAISSVGDDASVLATHEEAIVAAWDPPVLDTAFHPELTADSRIHDLAFFGESPSEP
jgi:5'-phosphate synthase pdxT subunit